MTESNTRRVLPRAEGFWHGRTEEELLDYNFREADPSRLENLLDEVPDTDEVPDVEFTYDTLLTGTGMVRCICCKRSAPNHNRGFVLRFADGRRMLFGRDCGEKIYGQKFVAGRNQFDEMMRRADLLKRKRHVFENRHQLDELFEAVEHDSAWSSYQNVRVEFIGMFPDLYSQIAEAVRYRDGRLTVEERVRDRDRELEHHARTGKRKTFHKVVTVPIHQLRGHAFFFTQTPIRAKDVADICKRARSAVWNFAGLEHKDIQLGLRQLDEIVATLSDYSDRVAALETVLSPANIAGLSEWLRRRSSNDGGLQLGARTLDRLDRFGNVRSFHAMIGFDRRASVALPENLPVAPADHINELARILSWRPLA